MVNDELFRRRWLVISLTFAVVVVFILRLFFLQLISSDYKQRAENNAYYVLSTIPSRGVIFDRNGQLLVANRPIFDLRLKASWIPPCSQKYYAYLGKSW